MSIVVTKMPNITMGKRVESKPIAPTGLGWKAMPNYHLPSFKKVWKIDRTVSPPRKIEVEVEV